MGRTDAEVGEWLADMATQKRGIDPSLLGNYFSRRDTLEVTSCPNKAFAYERRKKLGNPKKNYENLKKTKDNLGKTKETLRKTIVPQSFSRFLVGFS